MYMPWISELFELWLVLSTGDAMLLPWALVKMPRMEALIVRGCNLRAGPPFSIGFIVSLVVG